MLADRTVDQLGTMMVAEKVVRLVAKKVKVVLTDCLLDAVLADETVVL